MADQPVHTPIHPGLVERVAAGLRFMGTGDASAWNIWFGPGAPPVPQQPEVGGRQTDFPVATNMQWQPRVGEPVTFKTLRELADGYDLLRLVIETRKDQLAKLEWTIKPRDPKAKPDARCAAVEQFLRRPDQVHDWDQWNRAFWEDVLVTDALSILPRRTVGGDPYALDIIDGTTIKPVVGVDGRRPEPPLPAFQQVIKGIPVADFLPDDLYYRPHNVRSHKFYGYGKVEQVITTVNIALRRQLYQLQYYTEGSAPDMIFSVPESWNLDAIKKFSEWWWSMLSNGNTAQKRKGMFVPNGVKPIDTKEQVLKDAYDEWLARIICYAFSVAPQALVKEQSRATASTQKDTSKEEGLLPLMKFQKGVMDGILIDFFDMPDLQFSWQSEEATNPLEQAQIQASLVQAGIITINEARQDRGMEPIPEPENVPELPTGTEGERPQDTALNGPQIASLLQVIQTATGGQIPKGAAGPIIRASFPSLDAGTVDAMIAAIPDEPKKPDPVIPPPPAGNVPKPEGQAAVEAAPASTDEQPNGGGEPSAKLAKVKKTLKPIKRDRPLLKKLEARIEKTVAAYFKGSVRTIASEIHAAMPSTKLAKMSRDEAMKILEGIGLDFSDLGDDLEPILASIAQDGGLQALMQLGISDHSIVDQVNEEAVKWAEQHAAALVTQIADTTRDKIAADVAEAVEEGATVDELAAKLSASYGFSAERAQVIATTERAFADCAGNMKAYRASGVVEKKEWVLGSEHDDASECDCEDNANAGAIPLDDAFPSGDDTAPAHPRCFLPGTVVSAVGVSKHFKRWFEGEVVRLVVGGHDDITVTPNHPILTRRGWVRAAELQEGDDLVKATDPTLAVLLINPDDHQIETRIEDVADSLLMAGGVTTPRVPVSTKDFHGDGLSGHDVDVVSAGGVLGNHVDGMAPEPECCGQFGTALMTNSLAFGHGDLLPVVVGLGDTPDGIMRGHGAVVSPLLRHPGSLDDLAFAQTPNRQTGAGESVTDCGAMAAETLGKIDARLSGLITTVKLDQLVTGEKFSGHVFNLQTETGWYFANGIVAHNCVCDVLPVVFEENQED